MQNFLQTLEYIGQNGSLSQHPSTDKLLKSLLIEDCSKLMAEINSNDQFCGLLPADDDDDGDAGGASEEE